MILSEIISHIKCAIKIETSIFEGIILEIIPFHNLSAYVHSKYTEGIFNFTKQLYCKIYHSRMLKINNMSLLEHFSRVNSILYDSM
jgi:hypothetical protein